MNKKQQFQKTYPGRFFLENNVKSVEAYLNRLGFLQPSEQLISLEKPGEGNMNFVLRAITTQRSFIMKQARPWVEKFPEIGAPVERVSVEARYFNTVGGVSSLANYSPDFLAYDAPNFILLTEDLGTGADYAYLYQVQQELSESEVRALMHYLSALHRIALPTGFPDNLAMRQLNHEHIFNFPFAVENGFNLDDVQEGLQVASMAYKTNEALKKRISAIGERYLSKEGRHLLHGDFYPGSWLKVTDGLKIIDPEFSYVGPAEFDMGVFVAHSLLTQQSNTLLAYALQQYESPASFDQPLMYQFAGVEILRRLIGIAQLPITYDLSEKEKLMAQGMAWIEGR